MRKLITSFILILLTVSVVMADWLVDFKDDYDKLGIDKAVKFAWDKDVDAFSIMENGLQLENLPPMQLIKAMYCAKIPGDKIRESAKNLEVSKQDVATGFKKAIEECDIIVSESQAYTALDGGSQAGPGEQPEPKKCRKCVKYKIVKKEEKERKLIPGSPDTYEDTIIVDKDRKCVEYREVDCK